jgi:hypothetical protein
MKLDEMIQAAQLAFLALLLAHLVGDFLFQPKWLAENKGKRLWPLLCHGFVHYASAWACLLIFASTNFLSVYNQAVIAGYFLAHLLIDKLKSLVIAHKPRHDQWHTFLLDQLIHIFVLAMTACFLARTSPVDLFQGLHPSPSARAHILEVAIVYIGVIFGGGYLIRYLTRSFAIKNTDKNSPQLENAGLYVGWIERFLMITAILMQSPVLVGLILTGKSIARYPAFEHERFAEYFLIGTMLSVSLSVLGGMLLLYLLYGTTSFK